jgi:hypothetical protein
MEEANSQTTKLLTLLNVSAAKSLRLKRVDQPPPQKLNQKRRALDNISDAELETTGHHDEVVQEASKEDHIGDVGVEVPVNEADNLSETEGT